jgi:NAD(P)-dependent dehydrogenase (short-subunit alcohol dehydrogenase family)
MTSEQSARRKIYLVTGATSGIGKVIATTLAAQEAEVVIVGRNAQKTQATVQQIRTETGNDSVHFLLADFSDLGQVRDLAVAFRKQRRGIFQRAPSHSLWSRDDFSGQPPGAVPADQPAIGYPEG